MAMPARTSGRECRQVQISLRIDRAFGVEADFILIILVADMAQYERLTRKLFFDSGNVRKFKTFIAMDNVKSALSVPL